MPTFALLPPAPVPGLPPWTIYPRRLTGTHRDNVLHTVNSRLILHGFRVAMLCDSFQSIAFAPVMAAVRRYIALLTLRTRYARQTHNQFHMQRVVHPGDMVQRFRVVRLCFRVGC